MLYVIVYDVPHNKRRTKIATLLEGYGKRVQYSVFECYLESRKLTELKKRLKPYFKEDEDSIRFYGMTQQSLPHIETWGKPSLTTPPQSQVI